MGTREIIEPGEQLITPSHGRSPIPVSNARLRGARQRDRRRLIQQPKNRLFVKYDS